jgi:hypothetical protein
MSALIRFDASNYRSLKYKLSPMIIIGLDEHDQHRHLRPTFFRRIVTLHSFFSPPNPISMQQNAQLRFGREIEKCCFPFFYYTVVLASVTVFYGCNPYAPKRK